MQDPIHIVSVIAIFQKDNTFLLVKRSRSEDMFPGKWQNLGGKVEEGELIEQAIRREVYEEIGIQLKENITPIFIQSYSFKSIESSPARLGLVFLIEDEISDNIFLCDELESYGWFRLSEIENLDTIGRDSPTGTLAKLKDQQISVEKNYRV